MIVLAMMLPRATCVMAVLTFAEHPTGRLALITLAIVFYAVSLPTLATLLHLLQLKSQTECQRLLLWVLFLLLLMLNRVETMRVSCQCLNYRLFMLSHILLMIPTVITVAMLVAEYFLLETFAIKFQAFRSFAIATQLFFTYHIIFLLVNRRW